MIIPVDVRGRGKKKKSENRQGQIRKPPAAAPGSTARRTAPGGFVAACGGSPGRPGGSAGSARIRSPGKTRVALRPAARRRPFQLSVLHLAAGRNATRVFPGGCRPRCGSLPVRCSWRPAWSGSAASVSPVRGPDPPLAVSALPPLAVSGSSRSRGVPRARPRPDPCRFGSTFRQLEAPGGPMTAPAVRIEQVQGRISSTSGARSWRLSDLEHVRGRIRPGNPRRFAWIRRRRPVQVLKRPISGGVYPFSGLPPRRAADFKFT